MVGQHCETAERLGTQGLELELHEVLAYVKRIEEAKTTHAANAVISLHLKKITQAQMGPLQELAKIRSFDKLYFDTGVEEEDITSAFIAYKLSENEEFKQIIAGQKAAINEKVQVLLNKLAAPSANARQPGNQMAAAGAP